MRETVFLNAKFIPAAEAGPVMASPGFLSGYGLFETMRSCRNKIVYFPEHLRRLKNSAHLIGLALARPYQLRGIISDIIRANRLLDAYVRVTLWKSGLSTEILVTAKKYQPWPPQKYKNGFSAGVAAFRQNENSLLAGLKSTSRLGYELSFQQARREGFDEAIILNNRGYIAEGSRSNIFLVKDNALFTPALSCGCLNGITRTAIFDLAKKHGLKVYEGNFSCRDLAEADGAFLTNSLIGVMPLARLEKHRIGKRSGCKLTGYFIKEYNRLLRDGS